MSVPPPPIEIKIRVAFQSVCFFLGPSLDCKQSKTLSFGAQGWEGPVRKDQRTSLLKPPPPV